MTGPFSASEPRYPRPLACFPLVDPEIQSPLAWIVHFQWRVFPCPLTILLGLIHGWFLWKDNLPPVGTIVKFAWFSQDCFARFSQDCNGLAGADRV